MGSFNSISAASIVLLCSFVNFLPHPNSSPTHLLTFPPLPYTFGNPLRFQVCHDHFFLLFLFSVWDTIQQEQTAKWRLCWHYIFCFMPRQHKLPLCILSYIQALKIRNSRCKSIMGEGLHLDNIIPHQFLSIFMQLNYHQQALYFWEAWEDLQAQNNRSRVQFWK